MVCAAADPVTSAVALPPSAAPPMTLATNERRFNLREAFITPPAVDRENIFLLANLGKKFRSRHDRAAGPNSPPFAAPPRTRRAARR